jgi:hypothetical protein
MERTKHCRDLQVINDLKRAHQANIYPAPFIIT